MNRELAKLIIAKIDKNIEDNSKKIIAGKLSHDDYKVNCGVITGLETAKEIIKHFLTVKEKEDDPKMETIDN